MPQYLTRLNARSFICEILHRLDHINRSIKKFCHFINLVTLIILVTLKSFFFTFFLTNVKLLPYEHNEFHRYDLLICVYFLTHTVNDIKLLIVYYNCNCIVYVYYNGQMGRHTQLTMRNYGKSNQQTQEYTCKNNQFYPVTIIKNENKIQILPNQIMWHSWQLDGRW